MHIHRRTFLTYIMAAASYVLLGFLVPRKYRHLAAANKSGKDNNTIKDNRMAPKKAGRQLVSIEPCEDYDPGRVYDSLKKALDAIHFTIRSGAKVLLKPNVLGQNTPKQATTTHPAVIEAVIKIFSEKNCAISIGDSSAFYQGGCTRLGFETTGIAAVAKKYGAALLPFETTLLRKITTGKVLNPFYITGAVFDHDLVVNMPKLKIHRLARYTGAIKNTYGCVVGGTKQVYHKLFQEREYYQEFWGNPLVDVYEAVNPGLNIMDAVIGLDKDGPAANGEPRKTGLLLASVNGAALDTVVCRIIGFDPEWVPAVREALSRGLAAADKIFPIGPVPSIPYVRLPDLKQKTGLSKKIDDYIFDQFIVEPRISKSKCNKCGDCVKNCAPRAIDYNDKSCPEIDFKKCIYCYCCSEYCTKGAISLHGGVTNNIMRGIRRIIRL